MKSVVHYLYSRQSLILFTSPVISEPVSASSLLLPHSLYLSFPAHLLTCISPSVYIYKSSCMPFLSDCLVAACSRPFDCFLVFGFTSPAPYWICLPYILITCFDPFACLFFFFCLDSKVNYCYLKLIVFVAMFVGSSLSPDVSSIK